MGATPSREKTFGLNNCRDLLRKLEWEIDNYEKTPPQDLESLSFHAFNAAVTAWHIVDWVWADMTEEQRQSVARAWGITLSQTTSKSINQFAGTVRQKNRAINLCREIAIASKHVVNERNPDPAVNTTASATTATVVTIGGDAVVTSDGSEVVTTPTWALKVIDGGNTRPVLAVFKEALDYWTKFIDERGIAKS